MITLKIDQFGRPSAKATGIAGEGCKEPMSKIAAMLGGEQLTKDTPEMFEIAEQQESDLETQSY